MFHGDPWIKTCYEDATAQGPIGCDDDSNEYLFHNPSNTHNSGLKLFHNAHLYSEMYPAAASSTKRSSNRWSEILLQGTDGGGPRRKESSCASRQSTTFNHSLAEANEEKERIFREYNRLKNRKMAPSFHRSRKKTS